MKPVLIGADLLQDDTSPLVQYVGLYHLSTLETIDYINQRIHTQVSRLWFRHETYHCCVWLDFTGFSIGTHRQSHMCQVTCE